MTTTLKGAELPYRRKLIEVDLPLDKINEESRKDGPLAHGHPSTLHKWWARRPLATCRAVLFASMVDDPEDCPEEFGSKEEQEKERTRLHNLIAELVKWETTIETKEENKVLLNQARWEIARSVARKNGETPPNKKSTKEILDYLKERAMPIYDPFCGGGSIPLEAQRLGLNAVGGDLNPVAVLITKAMIELPHQFKGQPPINPKADPMGMTVKKGRTSQKLPWRGNAGLADDLRYYGNCIRQRAWNKIGHLYPVVKLPSGKEVAPVTWLWARTIPCNNPACGIQMPLLSTLQLQKNQREEHWINPTVDSKSGSVSWKVQNGRGSIEVSQTASKKGGICIACGTPVRPQYIRDKFKANEMGYQMLAIVASDGSRKVYLTPTKKDMDAASKANPAWRPPTTLPEVSTKAISLRSYGWTHWHNAFTERQLLTMTTFSDFVQEARTLLTEDGASTEYADLLSTYLAFGISRLADSGCSFTVWESSGNKIAAAFSRQGLGMVWDFPEANPFSNGTQNWMAQIKWIAKVLERLPEEVNQGFAHQVDASQGVYPARGPIIVTDPPYYNSVFYSDTSDFFYTWLRPILRDTYPSLFSSILTPKNEEMIANQYRFDDYRERFEDQLATTLKLIRERCSDDFPSSIFYAYKQQERAGESGGSTEWEAMLSAVIGAGFRIVSTWPMRTENPKGLKSNRNALASSVVLVCRPRPSDAPNANRREFLNSLEAELPIALDHLTREGHIAPVDLAQAAIGPGMQIYSRYSSVETISGDPVTVGEALAAINQAIANYDERQEGELDPPTRFCVDWLKQYGFGEGAYGEAELLARAKDVAIEDELRDAHGLVTAQGGNVQLQPPEYYSANRMPSSGRITAWEGCYRMAWNLDNEDGSIQGAAAIARLMGSDVEEVERLARILYNHFDRVRDSSRAILFNNLVTSWNDINAEMSNPPQGQMELR